MAIDAGSGLTTYVLGIDQGSSSSTTELVHVLEDGSLDPGFGSAGGVLIPGAVFPVALHVQSDGNILVGGGGGSAGAFVERLRVDGSLDASFGAAGVASLGGLFGSAMSGVGAVVIDADGRILALVENTNATSFAVVRMLGDGTPDPTYGSGGISVAVGVFDNYANLAVQPDGDAILVGPTISGAAIVRITN